MWLRSSILIEIYRNSNNACRTIFAKLLKYIWCILFIECKVIKYERRIGGSSESMIYCKKKPKTTTIFHCRSMGKRCVTFVFQSLKCTRKVSHLYKTWTGGTFPSVYPGAVRPVLVLARNQVQVARFAKHLPVQRIAAVLIWFRRELDEADLQTVRKTN